MWSRLRSFLLALLRRDRFDASVSEELQFHLEARAHDLVVRGFSREEAERRARAELGSLGAIRDEARRSRGVRLIDESRQDLRYAIRLLRRNPGFAAVATAVLAVGLGIGTAAFSIIDAVMLKPLPIDRPESLRFVYVVRNGTMQQGLPYTWFGDFRTNVGLFEEIAGHTHDLARMRTEAGDIDLDGESVTGNYFGVLGIHAALGRTLTPDDDRPNAAPAIVLSDSLWRARFRANPSVVGAVIRLGFPANSWASGPGGMYTVVGVAPPAFSGLLQRWEPADYWVPLEVRRLDDECLLAPGTSDIQVLPFGRLQPDVSDAHARAAVAQFDRDHHDSLSSRGWSLTVADGQVVRLPFAPRVVPARWAAAVLFVCALVMAIAIANLAGVLLARGVARRAEIGVRLTLGAGPWRLARQMLIETSLIALAGAALGLGLARAALPWIVSRIPPSAWDGSPGQHIALEAPLDVRVWFFITGVSFVTTCLIAIGPIRQALRTELLSAITNGPNAPTTPRTRTRSWIVVAQFSAALVLIIAAGIVSRHLIQSEATDPGYRPDGVVYVSAQIPPPSHCKWTKDQGAAWRFANDTFMSTMLRQTVAASGVESAAIASELPWYVGNTFAVSHGSTSTASNRFWIATNSVSRDYFKTMGISVLAGRGFDDRDIADSRPVAVICQRLAQWMFPKQDPIGQQIAFDWPGQTRPLQWLEIVGVVKEIRPPYSEGEPNPTVYRPFLQSPGGASYILARSDAPTGVAVGGLSRTMDELEPRAVTGKAGSISDGINEIRFPRRAAAALLSACGLAGLGLACLGLYGVVSYSVARRMREVGIRATLGASRSDLMTLVLLEGSRVAGVGTAIGCFGAVVALRLTSRFVVAVPSVDATTCLSVAGLLAAVVLLACYFPARRAARVDPIVVLRSL
jgi:predicted permease